MNTVEVWIADKIKALSETFAIDMGYEVMNNHYRIVLRVGQESAEKWSSMEIINRWNELFKLPVIISRY